MKINQIPKIILWPSLAVALLVLYISIEAILETQNWSWFDIDFTNKDKVISGYGALLAAIVSTFSIILLVYTIYLQIKESRKQAKRFRKEYKLQKQQFEEEKRREERKEKLDLYYKLKLISVFLESIIDHIEKTAIEIKRFFDAESENPLGMNKLYFLVNKSMSKLIEMDYLGIFIAFKEFLQGEEDWTDNFNDLFDLVGFYNDALLELREKYSYHINDKFNRKSKIGDDLKSMMDFAAKINMRYKELYILNNVHPYYESINFLVSKYYSLLDEDVGKERETDLDKVSQEILLPFSENIFRFRPLLKEDKLGMEELLVMVSTIRKNIFRLKNDCSYFANDVEIRYNDYFSSKSKELKKLKELKNFIDKELGKINPDEL